MILFFLSSGLFLGWALGANHAGNVFGTAVGTKMIRFKTAAIICSIFVIAGAVISGAGATHTLQRLGSVNAIAGSFIVALSTGLAIFLMTRWKMPVSTSQGIVGAIIGWNLFAGALTDFHSLRKIVITWIIVPVMAACISFVLFLITKAILNRSKIHLLQMDMMTRIGLLVVGAFGSYSLGANNIANVMGVFARVTPFSDLTIFNAITLTGVQQLFALGGIAIAVGVFTYSHKVMETVGSSLLKMSPVAALIVVLAHSIVLFLFSSETLEHFLASNGLPTIPLVPLSSSQVIIGALIGIGLLKKGNLIKLNVLGNIGLGWIATPILAGLIAFISLFIFQNVFDQQVYHKVTFDLNAEVIRQLENEGVSDPAISTLQHKSFENPATFESELKTFTKLSPEDRKKVIDYSLRELFKIDQHTLTTKINRQWFSAGQVEALERLIDNTYNHRWQLVADLKNMSPEWHYRDKTKLNKRFNKDLEQKYQIIFEIFRMSNTTELK
ncbi:anion permease [candidate division KSB1 bacterium]|nr:anion permease [candidate division KSB1 bacterium]